jgi:hypothetical protein
MKNGKAAPQCGGIYWGMFLKDFVKPVLIARLMAAGGCAAW